MRWTPERHTWARQLADQTDGDIQILLGYALDHIEDQQRDLQRYKDILHAAVLMASVACDILGNPALDKPSYREAFWKYKRRYDAVRTGKEVAE